MTSHIPGRTEGSISSEDQWSQEVNGGSRFRFGRNWRRYLGTVDESKIHEAERSLEEMLGNGAMKGEAFLDVGCGSGLFSLAALRLGAATVRSFDFDAESVACALELKRRFASGASHWIIEQGSVLDEAFVSRLGRSGVVYSWGVLHHTGQMWKAIANVSSLVADRGLLFISIYNDQGRRSELWKTVKRLYNSSFFARVAIQVGFVSKFVAGGAVRDLQRGVSPLTRYRSYGQNRGMSMVHDWFDWLGGYPFEVARPEAVQAVMRDLGFDLVRAKTVGDQLGCNQFVFRHV